MAELSVTGATIGEDEGNVTFEVELSEPIEQDVHAVFNTSDGSAIANIDYVPVEDHELVFSPGETSKFVSVGITDNLLRDGFRFFSGTVTTSGVGEGRLNQLNGEEWPSNYIVSNDGHTVFFTNIDRAIFRVPIDGSEPPQQLSPPMQPVAGIIRDRFLETPDSRYIVFVSNFEEAESHHLYRIPIGGAGEPMRLTGHVASGSVPSLFNLGRFTVTPDSKTVVYDFQSAESGDAEIYSAPIDGSTSPIPIGVGRDQSKSSYRLADDGRRVVYQHPDDLRVYSVPVDGSEEPIELTDGIEQPHFFDNFSLSPDGRTAFVYAGGSGFYSLAVDGSASPVLLSTLVGGHSERRVTADGRTVVFRLTRGIVAPDELYSVPIDGSAEPTRLHRPFTTGQDVLSFDLSKSGETVAFNARQDGELNDVYSVPADGSSLPKRLSDSAEVGSANWIGVTPDGGQAVFVASKQVGDATIDRVYSVSTDGSSEPVMLTDSVAVGERISVRNTFPTINPGGRLLTYVVQREDALVALYTVKIDGSSPPAIMNGPIAADGGLGQPHPFKVASGGIVFRVNEDDPTSSPPQVVNLYSNTTIATGFARNARAIIRDDEPSTVDFGDAPNAAQSGFSMDYPVTFAQDGARHSIGPLFLGYSIDADIDGQPDSDAGQTGLGGDDANESDGDSGVSLLASVLAADTATISSVRVNASESGKIDAWIDFNQDGDWSDPGEQIATNADVNAGENTLPFTVPANAIPGDTAARFRLSTSGGLSPTGPASDGEVEDYLFSILGTETSPTDVRVMLAHHTARLRLADSKVYLREIDVDTFGASIDDIGQVNLVGSSQDNGFVIFASAVEKVHVNVDGVEGSNLLRLRNPDDTGSIDRVFDFTSDGNLSSHNVQTFMLGSLGETRIILDATSVSEFSQAGIVTIRGDDNDEITFEDAMNWRMGESSVVDGTFVRRLKNVVGDQEIATELPHAWQNVINDKDVNNDGEVTALDAIRVINELSRRGAADDASALADPLAISRWPGVYFDTTGDDRITSLDALVVINLLARQPASGEDEIAMRSATQFVFSPGVILPEFEKMRSIERDDALVMNRVDKRSRLPQMDLPKQEVVSVTIQSDSSTTNDQTESVRDALEAISLGTKLTSGMLTS